MNLLKKLSLIAGMLVVTPTCFLTSCANQNIPVDDIKITIDDAEKTKASNNTIYDEPFATYTFNIDGKTKKGDIIFCQIISQTVEGKTGSYIDVSSDTKTIILDGIQKSFDIKMNISYFMTNTLFNAEFALKISLLRNNEPPRVTEIKGFRFVNCTPTTKDMFEYKTEEDGSVTLLGFKKEKQYQKQIELCNVLFLPNNINKIEKNAFYNEESDKSTIPESIKYIYFYDWLDQSSKSGLTIVDLSAFQKASSVEEINFLNTDIWLIRSDAFKDCTNLKCLYFTNPNLEIQVDAFKSCELINYIDCSSISEPGDKFSWAKSAFDANITQNGTIVIQSKKTESIWRQKISQCDERMGNSWTYKSLKK